jgi:N-acetylneuraminic acid mutarotase
MHHLKFVFYCGIRAERKILVVGGVAPDRKNSGENQEYDPATDRWKKLAPIPTPRDHLAAGVVNGKLYAVGGRVEGSYARNLAINEEYDSAANRWRERAPMPTARSGIGAAVLNGKIFVFGGESPSGTFNQTESYDPDKNNWETWAPMPTPRHGLGAAARGNQIYAISGGPKPGGSFSSANEVFALR